MVALSRGRHLARALGASVHVIHAATYAPDDARATLDDLLAARPSPAGVVTTSAVVPGDPLDVIQTASVDFDIVVVGTHGRTGLEHLLLGSVAENVVRYLERPVLVARAGPLEPQRILVPIDFSDAARMAMKFGAALAEKLSIDLAVMHVIPQLPALEQAELTALGSASDPTWLGLDQHACLQAGEDLARFLTAAGLRKTAATDVRVGDPAAEIVAAASPSDLVMLGTHGRQDGDWVPSGSVADYVIRHAKCSVLATRTSVAS